MRACLQQYFHLTHFWCEFSYYRLKITKIIKLNIMITFYRKIKCINGVIIYSIYILSTLYLYYVQNINGETYREWNRNELNKKKNVFKPILNQKCFAFIHYSL